MKDLVLQIVKNLVEYPGMIEIIETRGSSTILLEISVAPEDIGKIIGKQGKIIDAIRTILISIASRNHLRVNLEVVETIDM